MFYLRFCALATVLWLTLSMPLHASASCAAGAKPSYDDVTYLKIVQYSLVGGRPAYTFSARRYVYARGGPATYASLLNGRTNASAAAMRAADPNGAFAAVVHVLQRHDFFDMHLQPTQDRYLDGPEDTIAVGRCGVETALSTIAQSDELDMSGPQAQALFALEDDLRAAIMAQTWVPQR